MGIDVGHVLVTSSKQGVHYVSEKNKHMDTVHCYPTTKSFVSQKVQAYLDSNEYKTKNYGDFLLHAAANLSLDMTIATLGDAFDTTLAEYKRLSTIVEQQCQEEIVMPCSQDGVPQIKAAAESCYHEFTDFGCGYKCVDRVLSTQATV
jgi:hypothetical protein